MSTPLVFLARIGSPHGVRGALNVNLAGQHLRDFHGKNVSICEPKNLVNGLLTDYGNARSIELARVEPAHGDVQRVQFTGINDRDAAAALTNQMIGAPLDAVRALAAAGRAEGEVPLSELWYFEMVGLSATDAVSGQVIGEITHVEDHGRNTVLTLSLANAVGGQHSVDIPLDYPGWQKADVSQRKVMLTDWQIFLET